MALLSALVLWMTATDPPLNAPDNKPERIEVSLSAAGEVDLGRLAAVLFQASGNTTRSFGSGPFVTIKGEGGKLTRRFFEEAFGDSLAFRIVGNRLQFEFDRDAEGWDVRLNTFGDRVLAAQRRADRFGMWARQSYRPNDPNRPTICLIHGINSNSGSFVFLIPELERAGYGVVLYDFAFNQDLDISAPVFVKELKAFRRRTGDRQPWALACHSMGGLLARYYVESPDYDEDVVALILIGPPNQGSAIAQGQVLLRFIEGIVGAQQGRPPLTALQTDAEDAAEDLMPGSAFLAELNRDGPRPGVPYYILAGNMGFFSSETRAQILRQYNRMRRGNGILGGLASIAGGDIEAVLEVISDGTGDGAVSVSSTKLEGATRFVVIAANHVELIRAPLFFSEPGPIACLPYLLNWLELSFADLRE